MANKYKSYKSRGNFPVRVCLKQCKYNSSKVCDSCFRFSSFQVIEDKILDKDDCSRWLE